MQSHNPLISSTPKILFQTMKTFCKQNANNLVFLSKSGFKTKSEAEKEGVIAYNDYLNTGNSFSASDMSYSDFLDYWLENELTCSKLVPH